MWDEARIKQLRKSYGETQSVFAGRLGISAWTLRAWEQANKPDAPSAMAEILLDRLQGDLLDGRVRPLPFSADAELAAIGAPPVPPLPAPGG